MAVHGADEAAAAFVKADGRGASPDDFSLDGEAANHGVVEGNEGSAATQVVIVGKGDARERYVLADDGCRFIFPQLPIIADRHESKHVGNWKAVPRLAVHRFFRAPVLRR